MSGLLDPDIDLTPEEERLLDMGCDAPKARPFRQRLPAMGNVTAVRWEGSFRSAISELLGDRYGFDPPDILIRGDEDDKHVPIGDWIIRDARGEFYSATDDQFNFWFEADQLTELREALDEIASYADDFPEFDPMLHVRDLAMEALGDA